MGRTINEALQSRQHNFNFIRLATSVAVIYAHSFALSGVAAKPFFAGISVTVFFILSGFLISASYERSKTLSQFAVARALRIYPALIAVILVSALIIGPVFTSHSLISYFTDSEVAEYLTNMTALRIQHSLPGVFENNPFPDFVNGSLWTLPLVLLCYALLVLVGVAVKKKPVTFILILVPVLLFIWAHPYLIFRQRYYNNIFCFAVGGLLYVLRKKIRLDYRLALLSLAVFIAGRVYLSGPVYVLVTGISCSYLVMFAAFIPNNYLQHVTKHGDFSYGLYIWAFPVQQMLVVGFGHWSPLANFFGALLIGLLLAILSWHLIEKKAIAMKSAFTFGKPPAVVFVKEAATAEKPSPTISDRV
jgi:peptidoglycan/LPS O-acetylase OafA/YrhL